MIVMILEKVPTGLRGELTRWLLEPKSGVFVGDVSARVRDLLFEKCSNKMKDGGVVQIWSTNNEQNFDIRMSGNTGREVLNIEGVQLIRIPGEFEKAKRIEQLTT